ncbi:MAG: hypothetical protein JXA77_10445 [Bacteroidales bacterium]|nr:hypothetical protein [Bacteroidales bacterium]MBN2817877.1 hypothetical protein [Bacteroidales bacterium]
MKNYTLLLFIVFLYTACKHVNTENADNTYTEAQGHQVSEQEIHSIYHRFPSPEEMLRVINKAHLEYSEGLVNSVENVEKYFNSGEQALNLGIYTADLAYLTLYGKHNESGAYFEAVFNLSEKLRVSSAFEISLLKNVQNNLTNPDSLQVFSDKAFSQLSDYLIKNNKEKSLAVISVGGFIEALYLSIMLSGDFNEENILIQRIADQKLVLENIINYVSSFNDEDLVKTIEPVYTIREVYNELIFKDEKTEVTRGEDGNLIVKGGKRLVISEEQYLKLKAATLQARNSITQN